MLNQRSVPPPVEAPHELRLGNPSCNKRQRRHQTKPTPGTTASPAITPPTDPPPVNAAAGTGAHRAFLPPLPAVPVPSRPSHSLVSAAILYAAPHTFSDYDSSGSTFAELTRPLFECSMCLDDDCASQGAVSLTVCGHEFHKACIGTALQFYKRCPVCRKWVGSKP
jgi:hypothetical protein